MLKLSLIKHVYGAMLSSLSMITSLVLCTYMYINLIY